MALLDGISRDAHSQYVGTHMHHCMVHAHTLKVVIVHWL